LFCTNDHLTIVSCTGFKPEQIHDYYRYHDHNKTHSGYVMDDKHGDRT